MCLFLNLKEILKTVLNQHIVLGYNLTKSFYLIQILYPFDLIVNYEKLLNNGYKKNFLDKIIIRCYLAFFLIFNDSFSINFDFIYKKTENVKLFLGIVLWIIYYFKDFSLALWKPRILYIIYLVSSLCLLFTFIGVLQVNENNFLIIFFNFYFYKLLLHLLIQAKNISQTKTDKHLFLKISNYHYSRKDNKVIRKI